MKFLSNILLKLFRTKQYVDINSFPSYIKNTRIEESKINLKLENKFSYLYKLSREEKTKLLSITEEDLFAFNVLDSIVDEFQKLFPSLDRYYIMDIVDACSMNIEIAYEYLSTRNDKLVFSHIEDNIILKEKGSEAFESIIKDKGQEKVQEREDYLLA